ncbi:glycoside hydrolase [Halalkalibacter sp. APA_J-10(15)]|uniref:glycoside hydrolase n=1 Tax=Halalkalibacter sp. APA_J-10(15) TaxID=2933805 RepID=UPI001FF6B7F9|nr:glycoside hydrolase [Halalkalibacter sp. APA_J-10(15)]MCK0472228.1 Ig-like domain-containing protein [Halalkalibacter sp. APA_J-10(15)]
MRKPLSILGISVLFIISSFIPAWSADSFQATAATNVDQSIQLDPSYQHEPFDGWGTALVWFANVIGGWPDEAKEELADLLFAEEGLHLNIGRYNIGGGDSPETEPYMRLGGAVPGYWNRPAEFGPPEDADESWEEQENWWDPSNPTHWDWQADEDQLWWVKAAMERGADTFEAFSNSPPYFMTQSGYTSGNFHSWDDNIKPDQIENFAKYLVRVVEYLEENEGVQFKTLSPINEPNNGYWGAGNRQEGANWAPETQAAMINAVYEQLSDSAVDTVVSAMDETNPSRFRYNWEHYDETTRANIGQLNVHTYWPAQRTSVRDIAKGVSTRLWMSEVDLGPSGIPQNHEDIRPALALSERIQTDIQELEPKAWVLWQAIEDEVNMNAEHENMNWGLIHVDFDPDDFEQLDYHINKKYYAMGQYSKFIRPGYQFINSNNRDALAAIDREQDQAVVVYTNHSAENEKVEIDLSAFGTITENAKAEVYVTSPSDNLAKKEERNVHDDSLTMNVQPQSITTFVISGVSGVNIDNAFLKEEQPYHFINKNSGKALDIGTDNESIVQKTKENEEESQHWLLQKATNGFSHTEYYYIVHQSSGKVLTVNDGAILDEKDEGDDRQKWLLSTFGNGEYTLLNAETRTILEVGGQSTNEDAPVGVWNPNAGNHQIWQLERTGITEMEAVEIVTIPGVKPELPAEISITYGDGAPVMRHVEWEEMDASFYAEENEFTVEGKIEGTDVAVLATVIVSHVVNIEPVLLKAVVGHAPSLPSRVPVLLENGAKGQVNVSWNEINSELYHEIGKFTISGALAGTEVEVKGYVQVGEPALENVALNPRDVNLEFPQASASFTGQWDNIRYIHDDDYSTDRWTNWDPNSWREEDWVAIDFGEEKTISHIDFFFYDDEDGTRPPSSLHVEYWTGSDWERVKQGELELDETVRTTEASLTFEPITTTKMRVVMQAMENACIAIVELVVLGESKTISQLGTDATLEAIVVNGESLQGFDPLTFDYTYEWFSDNHEFPEVEVVTSHLFANYELDYSSSENGKIIMTVLAEDSETNQVYSLLLIPPPEGEEPPPGGEEPPPEGEEPPPEGEEPPPGGEEPPPEGEEPPPEGEEPPPGGEEPPPGGEEPPPGGEEPPPGDDQQKGEGEGLPDTATNVYQIMLIGFILLIVGLLSVSISRKLIDKSDF